MSEGIVIKVLGPGCANCRRLEQAAKEAVARLGLDAEVVKVADIGEIMSFGIMATPALVVDDEVKSAGRVLSVDEVAAILSGAGR